MSTFRRILVSIGAPVVVLAGLALLWGVRNASQLKAQIEAWADSLEHSPNPVTLDLSFLPMYIEGDRVGKLDAVVVQRHEPGTVDSIRIAIAGNDKVDMAQFADCQLHLDPDAFDREGPMGFKRALTCVNDTSDMVRFGSVVFENQGREFALYLNGDDLPCEHMTPDAAVECTHVKEEIRRLRDEIREEIRLNIRRDVRIR
jgi:hypothetical protein